MNYFVEVDCVVAPGDVVKSKGTRCVVAGGLKERLAEFRVAGSVRQLSGPGGGHPVVRLRGNMSDLRSCLKEMWDDGYLASLIRPTLRSMRNKVVQ